MKYLPFVPPVQMTTLDGEAIVLDEGPLMLTHVDFLLGHKNVNLPGRLAEAEFGRGLDGGDFVDLQVSARRALREQAGTAAQRGYWELEDEHARRIVSATLKPQMPYPGGIAHNFIGFIKAARALSDSPPAEAKAPEQAAPAQN